MSNNTTDIIVELFDRLEEELDNYQLENDIEYLDHKKRSSFDYELEKQNFEQQFYHFPCEVISAQERIQISYTFYETDIWGTGAWRPSDKQFELSLIQIQSNAEIERAKYLLDKLREKYNYIDDDIHRALIGPKRHFQFQEDYEEAPVLVHLQNLYNNILSNDNTQLEVFNDVIFSKTVSDIYTEILLNHVQGRIKKLNPRLKQYRKRIKKTFQVEEVEMSKEIPLIKLGYNRDQQKQIIQFLYDELNPEFIEVSYPQFERHFITKRSKIKKIIWKGSEPEIAQLFMSMKNKNILVVKDQNKLIEHHFYNKYGRPYNNRQLSVSLSRTQIENYPEILNIIDKLEKLVLTFS